MYCVVITNKGPNELVIHDKDTRIISTVQPGSCFGCPIYDEVTLTGETTIFLNNVNDPVEVINGIDLETGAPKQTVIEKPEVHLLVSKDDEFIAAMRSGIQFPGNNDNGLHETYDLQGSIAVEVLI